MKQMICWKGLDRYSTLALLAAIMALMTFVLSGTSLSPAVAAPARVGSRYVIHGQLVPVLRHRVPVRATEKHNMLNLSVALGPRNSGELDRLIAEQNDPRSLWYHRYITPRQFTALFGPAQSTVNAVEAYLRSQGLRVSSVSANHLLMNASGTVESIERAFQVNIVDYTLGGRAVYAPVSEPSVPPELGGMIVNVGGLDNVAHYHRLGSLSANKGKKQHSGPGGYTPAELRTAYDVSPLVNSGKNGSGQTVGIFEMDGYNPSDVNTYLSHYGLGGPNYSNVLVDGAGSMPGEGAVEVELDMEIVSAMAPGAAQKIYIGLNSITGVNDLYNRIVSDDVAKVVSISWGACEAAMGNAELGTLDTIFKQGVVQGQAFFAASGDSGAYDCNDNSLAVDSPADDPNVVGVGGTTLVTGRGGTYASEAAWSCPSCTQRSARGAGSGGGISTLFARPGYQSGPNLTNPNREVPDVSANADLAKGYSVYCTVAAAGCPPSGWVSIGGTSGAAPLWAGIATDINQYLTGVGRPTLGSASAKLYTLYNTTQKYSPYHDVKTGDNLYYDATMGYDMATGIGTPDAWNIARDLASSSKGGGGRTMQLIANPSFEDGQTPWQEASVGGYQIIAGTSAHSGSHGANLCGYGACADAIWQTVMLPSNVKKEVFSYWLYIGSKATGNVCHDYFYARIRSSRGSMIWTAQAKCNVNASGWTHYTFDLTSALSHYRGQQVQVYFKGTTIAGSSTDFVVDDVALNVTYS